MAMIDVIRADEMLAARRLRRPRLRRRLVLDLSRNRSRRFCSTTCTNRAAVAAYRARRALSAEQGHRSGVEEPSQHLEEHLRLLGVHPVARRP